MKGTLSPHSSGPLYKSACKSKHAERHSSRRRTVRHSHAEQDETLLTCRPTFQPCLAPARTHYGCCAKPNVTRAGIGKALQHALRHPALLLASVGDYDWLDTLHLRLLRLIAR